MHENDSTLLSSTPIRVVTGSLLLEYQDQDGKPRLIVSPRFKRFGEAMSELDRLQRINVEVRLTKPAKFVGDPLYENTSIHPSWILVRRDLDHLVVVCHDGSLTPIEYSPESNPCTETIPNVSSAMRDTVSFAIDQMAAPSRSKPTTASQAPEDPWESFVLTNEKPVDQEAIASASFSSKSLPHDDDASLPDDWQPKQVENSEAVVETDHAPSESPSVMDFKDRFEGVTQVATEDEVSDEIGASDFVVNSLTLHRTPQYLLPTPEGRDIARRFWEVKPEETEYQTIQSHIDLAETDRVNFQAKEVIACASTGDVTISNLYLTASNFISSIDGQKIESEHLLVQRQFSLDDEEENLPDPDEDIKQVRIARRRQQKRFLIHSAPWYLRILVWLFMLFEMEQIKRPTKRPKPGSDGDDRDLSHLEETDYDGVYLAKGRENNEIPDNILEKYRRRSRSSEDEEEDDELEDDDHHEQAQHYDEFEDEWFRANFSGPNFEERCPPRILQIVPDVKFLRHGQARILNMEYPNYPMPAVYYKRMSIVRRWFESRSINPLRVTWSGEKDYDPNDYPIILSLHTMTVARFGRRIYVAGVLPKFLLMTDSEKCTTMAELLYQEVVSANRLIAMQPLLYSIETGEPMSKYVKEHERRLHRPAYRVAEAAAQTIQKFVSPKIWNRIIDGYTTLHIDGTALQQQQGFERIRTLNLMPREIENAFGQREPRLLVTGITFVPNKTAGWYIGIRDNAPCFATTDKVHKSMVSSQQKLDPRAHRIEVEKRYQDDPSESGTREIF